MSVSSESRVYGGATGEERVAERRRKLIEAGMNLFGSPGSESVRVKDVVLEAGLTDRYFYESFSDLGALFEEILDLTIKAMESEVNAAVLEAPDDPVARVSVAMRTTVDTLTADPRMIRIFFVEALGRGGRVGARRNEILTHAAENFFKWSGTDTGPFDSGPVESRMRAYAASGAASELLISWAEGLLDITSDQLAEYLVGLYWRINLP
ncbi:MULTISPECIES: TetR/AcrR family transcriptional regulator [Mycobacteroides]|uniref:TetR/AcrR family transcriptional regulator n=1 Tax=Mycobacteroides TaxID=670516 RepID=UPI000991E8F6|nr:TetR/AcrR family transcriptional regulator [Mycobacteroides immunogenum]WJR33062.1 TetR/AcrR family transcriptional regulator [Mycobacteroides immunogenum]